VTGSYVALCDAVEYMINQGMISKNPLKAHLAAISVGIDKNNELLLDLKYEEDSEAETDLNVIMTEEGNFVEIQGTAEGDPFTPEQFSSMITVASKGIKELIEIQKESLSKA
jgi:ribonuclease PH